MAEQVMDELAAELERTYDLCAVAIAHRVGRVGIGEPSVVIAVSAPHRGDALAACKDCIDRLKETVPLWKKEVYEGGEEWIEQWRVRASGFTPAAQPCRYRRSMDPVIRREPKEPEENGQLDEYGFEPVERGYEPIHPSSPWRDMLRKFWAPIALIGFVLWKFKAAFAAIFKLKLFTVVGSAFVSVAAYALIWGWQFGLGFVLLLFVHELGHVAVAKYQGLPVSAPVFIPFMGALILMKEMPQNAWREAQIALGGPILGALGAAACWGLGEAHGLRSPGRARLRRLLPQPLQPHPGAAARRRPRDRRRPPRLLGARRRRPRRGRRPVAEPRRARPRRRCSAASSFTGRAKAWWHNRGVRGGNRYYAIEPWQRLAVGAVYVGLSAVLVLAMAATQVPQDRL